MTTARTRHFCRPPLLGLGLMLIVCAFPARLPAAEGDKNPIDTLVEKEAEANPSTIGEVQAYDHGTKLWDKELNKAFQALVGKLKPESVTKLKASQLAWIKYRDAEIELIRNIYYEDMDGTMYRPMAANRVMMITRARAIELQDYLSLFDTR